VALFTDLRKEDLFDNSDMACETPVRIEKRNATRFYDRLDDLDSPEYRDGGVIFEGEAGSPYFMPLDGQEYRPEGRFGPIGTCPVCNNEKHMELDYHLASLVGRIQPCGMFGFSQVVLQEHLSCHMGPIYARMGLKACALSGKYPKKGAMEQMVYGGNNSRATINKAEARERHDDEDDDVKVLVLSEGDREWYDSAYERAENRPDPSPSKGGRPEGRKVGEWYAFDGAERIGALRPWGDGRVAKEVAKREEEAIVFYDEMLDARRMARQIYSDIMDSDIDAASEGRSDGKYIDRNYSAAISAVREIRSIATDMAKLALIATKYSDGKEARRVLSPVMQGMIDEIGVFSAADEEAGYEEAGEAEAEVVI